jgi:transposase InsO family protein
MKGFDYAKKVFCRVPPARLLHWFVPEVRQLLKLLMNLESALAGYYKYKHRPMAPTRMRRVWLTSLIREVHAAGRGTYGSRRVHAELILGMGVHVSMRLVAVLMSMNKIAHLPSVGKVKRLRGVVTADDLVNRKFHRSHPNELWVTDITEHPTREGKV